MTQLSASGSDGGPADSRFLKRSAVVKYALRQRANSYDAGSSRAAAPATPAAATAAAAATSVSGLRRRPSLAASDGLLADVDMNSTTLASGDGSGGTQSKVVDSVSGGGGSSGDYWYPTLLGLPPRRPKTCGAPSANGLERRLYAMTNAKHGPAAPAPPPRRRDSGGASGSSAGAERTPASAVGTKDAAATSSDRLSRRRPETAAAAASHLFWGSSSVPLRSVVSEEPGAAAESVAQPAATVASSLYTALQTGQCTLEYDMSHVVSGGDDVRPDLLPQPLTVVRRHHRDKTLHYGQIKLALSRDQVLEGAAIRDSADGSRPAATDRTGHSLQRLGSLRGSLPNVSVAGDGSSPQLQLPAAPPRNHHHHHQLRGPLLVSGIFNVTDESPTITTAARGRGGHNDGPRPSVTTVGDTAPSETNDAAATSQPAVVGGATLSWQQMLGPQRIPTVTKPPTIAAHHPSAPAAVGVSLPQRSRHHSRPGGGGGGGGGLSGSRFNGSGSASSTGAAVGATRAGPDDAGRQDAEPRYVDPFFGAPASMQTRLAEMAILESETVRWERSGGGKTKKKNGRDRDD